MSHTRHAGNWPGSIVRRAVLAALLAVPAATLAPPAWAGQPEPGWAGELETGPVRQVIARYVRALNAGDARAAAANFTEDAVWMPPEQQPITGRVQLEAAYRRLLSEWDYDMSNAVEEVISGGGGFAVLRSSSMGTRTSRASGTTQQIAAVELFILRRSQSGEWRIARYMFNRRRIESAR